jgi:hypothetical protein
MRSELAKLVLQSERAGLGLPKGVPGIWSEEEDKMAESGNATWVKRVEKRHGWQEVEARLKFLTDWREESVDADE